MRTVFLPLPTGVPDEKKGERLVVLYTVPEEWIKDIHKKCSQLGLPNLWVPRLNQFFHVESLPMLGTGKLDQFAEDVAEQDMNPFEVDMPALTGK